MPERTQQLGRSDLRGWLEPDIHAVHISLQHGNIPDTNMVYMELARSMHIYGLVCIQFFKQEKYIRSSTVRLYGSGQPYIYTLQIRAHVQF